MPVESTFYPRIFALVVAALLGYALLLIFRPFFAAMSWAAFLAFLLHPLNLRLRRRLRGKSGAAGLLTILTPIVILLPLSRPVDRIRRADLRLVQRLQQLGAAAGHQDVLGSAAISAHRARQHLAARHTRESPPARFNPGWYRARRRCCSVPRASRGVVFHGCARLAHRVRDHAVSAVFFSERRRCHGIGRAGLFRWTRRARSGCFGS